MDELNWGGGKNRQQKRDKQKQKGSRGKYSSKHVRVHQAMLEKAMKKKTTNVNKQNNKNNNKKQKGGANIVSECGEGTVYNPKECCLQGVKCITPCYKVDYDHDSYPCVDKEGNARMEEVINLTNCKVGTYNPDECCEKDDIGLQCIAPCQSGKNCIAIDGSSPFKKAMKIKRARDLMNTLRKINEEKKKQNGAGLYLKIVNPATNRKVNVNGKLGKQILQNYLNYLNN